MLKNFIEQTISGLQAGSIYALIALGYTMVYGIVGLINFAHGDILMIGSYIVLVCLSFGIPFIPALVISIVFCAILGVLIDFFAYRPLRNAPKISALITAIGMSFLLESVALIVFGANPRVINTNAIPSFLSADSNIKLGAINISVLTIFGSGLGALGGVLYAIMYPRIEPYMGMLPGLKAFIAAVFGGIGSIPGAMVGGYVLGIVESYTKGYISSTWANPIVFGVLVLILIFRPNGLFGKNQKEKV